MIYQIVLYFVLVLPLSINNYKKDGKKWLTTKIINSLITFYFFLLFAGNAHRLIFGLTDDTFLIMKDVPMELNIVFSIFYGVVSFFAGIQTIRLALRNEKARVYMIWMIPLFWILTGVDKYYMYIALNNIRPSIKYLIFSNVIYTFLWGSIFLFYSRKRTKEFFVPPAGADL